MDKKQRILSIQFVLLGCLGITASVTIIEGPVSQAVEPGNLVKFVCRVADQGNEIIRWFRIDTNKIISANGKILKRSNRRRYSILRDEDGEYSLVIQRINRWDNGTFACGVLSTTNEQPIMSNRADLAVIQSPLCSIVSRQPPAPGVTVKLTCESQNPGLDVELSWHRPAQPNNVMHGIPGPNQTFQSSFMDITLGPSDYGESFVCKENLNYPRFTRGCTITPLGMDLTVILFPKEMQAVEGQNATFSCIIASKNPLTYEWYINGYRDSTVVNDRFVFSPVMLGDNNTRIECRTRDSVTGMARNANSVLYVYPASNPIMSTRPAVVETENVPTKSVQPRVKFDEVEPTRQQPAQDLSVDLPVTERPLTKERSTASTNKAAVTLGPKSLTPRTTQTTLVSLGNEHPKEKPVNMAYDPQEKSVLGTSGTNRWSNMMVPILAVGSVIAVLLVCVIVVLLLFLVRQNRVAHGSMGGKGDSPQSDMHMGELRLPGTHAPPGNGTLNGDSTVADEEETMHPKYFTLEPEGRKTQRLQRTCSHTIVGDTGSEYNVLFRNTSLRMPMAVKMNDYARPDSQIFDGDTSTVSAYAVTDVTLGGGTSSLKRSRSCVRPLPAAPVHQVLMNRSHYNIPRDAYNKSPCFTESSGDSVTMPFQECFPRPYHDSNGRSQVAAAFVPAGDEYAEIDSPPRPASPVSSDCSRPHSPHMLPKQSSQTLKELTASLASSYESGYDAASSDDVMDSESTSPYAAIDRSYRRPAEGAMGPIASSERTVTPPVTGVAKSQSFKSKDMPVYAKVKRSRAIQVEDKNIDYDQGPRSEISC